MFITVQQQNATENTLHKHTHTKLACNTIPAQHNTTTIQKYSTSIQHIIPKHNTQYH